MTLLVAASCADERGAGGNADNGGNSSSGGAATTGGGTSGGNTASGGSGGTGGTMGPAGTTSTGATAGSNTAGSEGSAGDGGFSAGGTAGAGGREIGGASGSGGNAGAGAAGATSTGGSGGAAGSGGGGGPTCVIPSPVPTPPASARDVVDGELIQFNDNGAWSWFQDERAVVDVAGGKIVVGSDANDGLVEVVTYWGAQSTFDWTSRGCRASDRVSATYANVSAEGKIYGSVRSVGASPNFLVSSSGGQTFTHGGRLTSTPKVGHVAGYYRYWSNGVDRIDFVGTEAHPRDFDTSLYHGYVKGGKSFDSADKVIDENIADCSAPEVTRFTRVFAADTVVKGIRMTRGWMADIQSYGDGSIARERRTTTRRRRPRHDDAMTELEYSQERHDPASARAILADTAARMMADRHWARASIESRFGRFA